MVGVQTCVGQDLQDLVGGGIGPLLTRQRQHTRSERRSVRCAIGGCVLSGLVVPACEGLSDRGGGDAVAPGGVVGEGTVALDRGDTDHA